MRKRKVEQIAMKQQVVDMEKAYNQLPSEIKKMVDFLDNIPEYMDAPDTYKDGAYTAYTTKGTDGDSVVFNSKTNNIIIKINGKSKTLPYNTSSNEFKNIFNSINKQNVNEWTDRSFLNQPKRWSKNGNDKGGLTEFERKHYEKEETIFRKQMRRFNTKNMKW